MAGHFPGLEQAEIKSDGVKRVSWANISSRSEIIPSWKCFLHVSNMTTLTHVCICLLWYTCE